MNQLIGFAKADIEQSVPARLEKIVELYPEHLAVCSPERSLTYREFNQIANQIAHAIVDKRGNTQKPILLLLYQIPKEKRQIKRQ